MTGSAYCFPVVATALASREISMGVRLNIYTYSYAVSIPLLAIYLCVDIYMDILRISLVFDIRGYPAV